MARSIRSTLLHYTVLVHCFFLCRIRQVDLDIETKILSDGVNISHVVLDIFNGAVFMNVPPAELRVFHLLAILLLTSYLFRS